MSYNIIKPSERIAKYFARFKGGFARIYMKEDPHLKGIPTGKLFLLYALLP